ncbi:unnamed protein product [Protopolystoma xenopodis]|uniref:Uncharacterized protein n=1 Tax=Protopolystoma xenopodis TaxID=117903 RepID=A0A448XMH7_9PLAT|nr:unnamed protein product [Protopolystoma xenopodis]
MPGLNVLATDLGSFVAPFLPSQVLGHAARNPFSITSFRFLYFSLNLSLDSDPTASELAYSLATRASYRYPPTPVRARVCIDLCLGAGPIIKSSCGEAESASRLSLQPLDYQMTETDPILVRF